MSSSTRAASAAQGPHWSQELLGVPRDLPDCFLPTYSDLVRYYFWSSARINEKCTAMARHTIRLWEKAGIPALSEKGVFLQIQRFFQGKSKPGVANFKYFEKKHALNGSEDFNVLLDIAKCKCFASISSFEDCNQGDCSCKENEKISNLSFFFDQKSLVRGEMIVFSDKSLQEEQLSEERKKSRKRKLEEQEKARVEKSKKEESEQFET